MTSAADCLTFRITLYIGLYFAKMYYKIPKHLRQVSFIICWLCHDVMEKERKIVRHIFTLLTANRTAHKGMLLFASLV
jgi:hypothetical protein